MDEPPVEEFMDLELKELRRKVKAISYLEKEPLPTNERDRMVTLLAMHQNGYPIKNLDEGYLKKHTKKPLVIQAQLSTQSQSPFFNKLGRDIFIFITREHLDVKSCSNLGATCRTFYYLLKWALRFSFDSFLVEDSKKIYDHRPDNYFNNNRDRYYFLRKIEHPLVDEIRSLMPNGKTVEWIEERDLVRVHNAISKTGSLANMEIFLRATRDFRRYYIQTLYKRFVQFIEHLSKTKYGLFCNGVRINSPEQVKFTIIDSTGRKTIQFYDKSGALLANIDLPKVYFNKGGIFDNNLYSHKDSILGAKGMKLLIKKHGGKLFRYSKDSEKVKVFKLRGWTAQPAQKKLKL